MKNILFSCIYLMFAIFLIGCGSDTSTTTNNTPAVSLEPLIVSSSVADVKTVQFNWDAVNGALYYKLFVNPDGVSGFALLTDNIVGTSTSITLPVHLTDWINSTYIVEAHGVSSLLTGSDAISIASEMIGAIGYFKASNPGQYDFFGRVSLSSDGKTLAVGAPTEDSSTTGINGTNNDLRENSGAVYIFSLNGTTWSQQAFIKVNNPDYSDAFGSSISLSADGNTLAVGSPHQSRFGQGVNPAVSSNTALLGSGAAYVFIRNETTWSQQAYIKASNSDMRDAFGITVALSSDGNTLAIGAHREDGSTAGINGAFNDSSYNTGAVYVYSRSSAIWSQQAYVKASNPGPVTDAYFFNGDYFGLSISLSSDGNTMAVGAPREDSGSAEINGNEGDSLRSAGAVYVFSRNGITWSQQAYIKASNPLEEDQFGSSVDLSSNGNTLAVGIRNTSGLDGILTKTGAVHIFTRTISSWNQQAILIGSNLGTIDGFGISISLTSDGNTLVVGAYRESGSAGTVYVFNRSDNIWSQIANIRAINPDSGDKFGSTVSLSSDGNTLAIGAPSEYGSTAGINGSVDDLLFGAGAVYLY